MSEVFIDRSNKAIKSKAINDTFSSIEVTGEIAKKIQKEMLEEPTEEAIEKNKKASELLHKVRSS